jgi:hypothetical protein
VDKIATNSTNAKVHKLDQSPFLPCAV